LYFRSAIKKILERDDSASRSMVLCVASLNVIAFDKNNESNTKGQSENVSQVEYPGMDLVGANLLALAKESAKKIVKFLIKTIK
jgi:hypothetical protein